MDAMTDGPTAGAYKTGSDAVTVHAIFEPPHNFVEMHHYEDGWRGALLHYCPTGLAMCTSEHDPECTAVRDFDGDCRLWGRSEDGVLDTDIDMTAEEWDEAWARAAPVRLCKSRREYLIRRRIARLCHWLRRWQR